VTQDLTILKIKRMEPS